MPLHFFSNSIFFKFFRKDLYDIPPNPEDKHNPHNPYKYKCTHCDKRFTNKYNQERHVKKEHTIGKNIKCNFCEKCFSTFGALKSHVDVIHAKPLGLTADTIGPAILPAIKPKQPNFENVNFQNFKVKGAAIMNSSKHVNCHICHEKILVAEFTQHCKDTHGKKCFLAPPKDIPEDVKKTIGKVPIKVGSVKIQNES